MGLEPTTAANTVGIIKMRIENNIVYENINKLVFLIQAVDVK